MATLRIRSVLGRENGTLGVLHQSSLEAKEVHGSSIGTSTEARVHTYCAIVSNERVITLRFWNSTIEEISLGKISLQCVNASIDSVLDLCAAFDRHSATVSGRVWSELYQLVRFKLLSPCKSYHRRNVKRLAIDHYRTSLHQLGGSGPGLKRFIHMRRGPLLVHVILKMTRRLAHDDVE